MKRLFYFLTCCVTLNASAQINAIIEKKSKGDNIFICTTLTNNSDYLIHVIDGSLIANDGGIESTGHTYIVFSSYDANNNLLETSKIPFSLSDAEMKKPLIKLPIGQSRSSCRVLFPIYGCFGIFSKEASAKLKYIRAKVHVCYARPSTTDETFKELDIDVNQIVL
jgi:hypothetical protein